MYQYLIGIGLKTELWQVTSQKWSHFQYQSSFSKSWCISTTLADLSLIKLPHPYHLSKDISAGHICICKLSLHKKFDAVSIASSVINLS